MKQVHSCKQIVMYLDLVDEFFVFKYKFFKDNQQLFNDSNLIYIGEL